MGMALRTASISVEASGCTHNMVPSFALVSGRPSIVAAAPGPRILRQAAFQLPAFHAIQRAHRQAKLFAAISPPNGPGRRLDGNRVCVQAKQHDRISGNNSSASSSGLVPTAIEGRRRQYFAISGLRSAPL